MIKALEEKNDGIFDYHDSTVHGCKRRSDKQKK